MLGERLMYELAQLRASPILLTLPQIQQIDDMTNKYAGMYKASCLAEMHLVWKLLGESLEFWTNMLLLLDGDTGLDTKLHALVSIRKRVSSNWVHEVMETRNKVKQYMCNLCQNYQPTLPDKQKSLYREVNVVICEILKYEWLTEWPTFLPNICQQLLEFPPQILNYLHLLHTIFNELFVGECPLTSYERECLQQMITNNYSVLHQILERVLESDDLLVIGQGLKVLDSVLKWIPAYYVYFGLVLEKLVRLLSVNGLQGLVLNCLEAIYEMETDETIKQCADKVRDKKGKLLLQILLQAQSVITNQHPLCNVLHNKIVHIIRAYVKSGPCEEVSMGVCDWLILHDDGGVEAMQVLIEVLPKIKNYRKVQQLMLYVIALAPCPKGLGWFYESEGIMEDHVLMNVDKEGEETYVTLLQLMTKHHAQPFYTRLKTLTYPMNLQNLQSLCHYGWCTFYTHQISLPANVENISLLMLHNYFLLEDKAKSILTTHKDEQKQQNLSIKILLCIRSLILLALCQKWSVPERQNQLMKFAECTLKEDEHLMELVLSVMGWMMEELEPQVVHNFTHTFEKYIRTHQNCFGLLERYVEMVEVLDDGLYVRQCQILLDVPRKRFMELMHTSISKFAHGNVYHIQVEKSESFCALIRLGEVVGKVLTKMVKKVGANVMEAFSHEFKGLYMVMSYVSKMEEFRTIVEIYLSLYGAVVQQQPPRQYLESLPEHLLICRDLYETCQMHRQCVLAFFIVFIKEADKEIHPNYQTEVNQVLDLVLGFGVPPSVTFLHNLISCKTFLMLSIERIQTIIYLIIKLYTQNQPLPEAHTLVTQLLQTYLNQHLQPSPLNSNFLSTIWKYLIDIIIQTLRTFFTTKATSTTQILTLQLIIVQDTKSLPFISDQKRQNIEEIHQHIIKFISQHFGEEKYEGFRSWADETLTKILLNHNKKEVKKVINDFLIVLGREYLL